MLLIMTKGFRTYFLGNVPYYHRYNINLKTLKITPPSTPDLEEFIKFFCSFTAMEKKT